MKIERDKWYVMRNGAKVRVVCVDAPGGSPVIAVPVNGFGVLTYTASGHYDDGQEHRYDLISEHREPARVWVNFGHTDHDDEVYRDQETARDMASDGHTRIAVEFVEVVNGRDDG